ncbi:MAG: DegV family protein [Clostridium sp.]
MIKIITDSSSLYTIEEGEKIGIDALPLCVSIGANHYRDLQVDMDIFYRQIEEQGIPISSQPPLGEVLDAYHRYEGQTIINITMADGLSGTYDTACSARQMSDNCDDITVFNSRTLCGPHRYMVEQAQMMVEAGSSYEMIMARLEHLRDSAVSFLIPQDFAFLRRGGRLTPLAATFGSLLNLKPIMTTTPDGKRLDKFGIGRTLSSAIKHIIKYMKLQEIGDNYILYISHAAALCDALKVQELFKEAFGKMEIQLLELSPAFVTQGGPQCIAIQYVER